jgi:signal peptidase I
MLRKHSEDRSKDIDGSVSDESFERFSETEKTKETRLDRIADSDGKPIEIFKDTASDISEEAQTELTDDATLLFEKDETSDMPIAPEERELLGESVLEEKGYLPDPRLPVEEEDELHSIVIEGSRSLESDVLDDESIGGRVVDIHSDRQDIIIPDGPSKLDGEVFLVRRPGPAPDPSGEGIHVKRVKSNGDNELKEDESRGFMYSFLDTLRFISLGLMVGILLVVFVVQRNDVFGSSMEPTLYNQDAVFVEMISVYLNQFDRGDIVTIDAEGMEGYYHKENLIKRIIGLPGETVKIIDGTVYINGNQLIEPYLTDGVMTYVSLDGVENGYDEITLGPGEYFCLGDNRGASMDSRELGPINIDRIKAHVIARIYPFDAIELF